jgi:hypothetical protein
MGSVKRPVERIHIIDRRLAADPRLGTRFGIAWP